MVSLLLIELLSLDRSSLRFLRVWKQWSTVSPLFALRCSSVFGVTAYAGGEHTRAEGLADSYTLHHTWKRDAQTRAAKGDEEFLHIPSDLDKRRR